MAHKRGHVPVDVELVGFVVLGGSRYEADKKEKEKEREMRC